MGAEIKRETVANRHLREVSIISALVSGGIIALYLLTGKLPPPSVGVAVIGLTAVQAVELYTAHRKSQRPSQSSINQGF